MSTLFRPIRTDADLRARVQLHQTTESLYLDFKCEIQKQGEKGKKDIAIDVAAFTNTWGGTLLIGINDKTNADGVRVAVEVVGCSFESDRKWIEQVVRDRVFPADVGIECVLLRWDDKVVMAVNISPDDRLIASWDRIRETFFPIRNNEGNAYMSPSEIVERANTSARSGQIKLIRAAEQRGTISRDDNGALQVRQCAVNIVSPVFSEQVVSGQTRRTRFQAEGILDTIEPHQFRIRASLKGGNLLDLWLPFGLIREAWPMDKAVGLMLHVDLRWTQDRWFVG